LLGTVQLRTALHLRVPLPHVFLAVIPRLPARVSARLFSVATRSIWARYRNPAFNGWRDLESPDAVSGPGALGESAGNG